MLKIIADENIPYAKKVFSTLGHVTCCSGREMTRQILKDCDVLLVRSITKVTSDLLEGTPVHFVGTATIGTDHIDIPYLQAHNIAFSNAAGSNANSVAEYIMTALLVLAQKYKIMLSGKTLGIIGLGNIGSLVSQKAAALELHVIANDPPLQRKTDSDGFVSLNDLLTVSDIITCHVPLNRTGPDTTVHLLNEQNLKSLKPNAILLNSSRGPVVDNQALKNILKQKTIHSAVLDVWENEPNIDTELLNMIDIATPHIAGYSLDGKVNGTFMIYHALCDFLGTTVTIKSADLLPAPAVPEITLTNSTQPTTQETETLLYQAMQRIYNIMADDTHLRKITQQPPQNRGEYFDSLRRNYPVRREASNTRIKLITPDMSLKEKLSLLGFNVSV